MKLKQRYWGWRDDSRAHDCAVLVETGTHVNVVLAVLLFTIGVFVILELASLLVSIIWVIPLATVFFGYVIFCELVTGLGALRLGWIGFAYKNRLRKFILEKVNGR